MAKLAEPKGMEHLPRFSTGEPYRAGVAPNPLGLHPDAWEYLLITLGATALNEITQAIMERRKKEEKKAKEEYRKKHSKKRTILGDED